MKNPGTEAGVGSVKNRTVSARDQCLDRPRVRAEQLGHVADGETGAEQGADRAGEVAVHVAADSLTCSLLQSSFNEADNSFAFAAISPSLSAAPSCS